MGCLGVVQLLDAFFCSRPKKSWCLVYEFHGTSLYNVLAEGSVPVTQLRNVLLDVLTGIECIHRAGFLHADVKPANILVLTGGHELGQSGHVPRWSAVVGDVGSAVEVPCAWPFVGRCFVGFHWMGALGEGCG